MIKVFALQDTRAKEFSDMFAAYYKELGCEDETEHLVGEYIIPDLLAGLLKVDLLSEEDVLCGFAIYQIDKSGNEWNFKEGAGDIREIYVIPPRRRKGLGKFLLYSAEMRLREAGAESAYCVPDELSVPFFTACGYTKTDEACDELDGFVYLKSDLKNTECGR